MGEGALAEVDVIVKAVIDRLSLGEGQ